MNDKKTITVSELGEIIEEFVNIHDNNTDEGRAANAIADYETEKVWLEVTGQTPSLKDQTPRPKG